ncbi:hypothetical protein MOXK02_08930 [Moraxella sp. K02]
MLVLILNPDHISVRLQDNLWDIGLTLKVITETLHVLPPTELSWETAIMRIEDAISPLKPSFPKDELLKVIGAEDLRLLAFEQDDNGDYIRAEMLEKAFAVLAGYRSLRDLPAMPNDLAFYAKVLLLREWVHHLDFDKLYLG